MISDQNIYPGTSDNKIEVLDSLRAFAALSVVLFHFVCTTTGYIETEWILNMFSVGKYGVQLFFVISGFIIPWSMHKAGYNLKDFFSFFLKRLARLEPPYLFSIILALLVLYLRENYLGKANDHMEVSAKQVMLHLGYLIPFTDEYKWLNPVYWTLAVEFQYYIFIALLFVPLIKSPIYLRSLIYAGIIPLSFVAPENFLFYWLPVFFLGIILFLYKSKLILNYEYYIATGVMLIFCFYRYPPASVVYSCIPLVCVLVWPHLKIPVLNSIGKFSYSVYLIHPILGASLVNILSHHFVHPLAKAGVITLGILFTIACSWITYLLIERPSKNLSSSIKYKKVFIL